MTNSRRLRIDSDLEARMNQITDEPFISAIQAFVPVLGDSLIHDSFRFGRHYEQVGLAGKTFSYFIEAGIYIMKYAALAAAAYEISQYL